MSPQTNNILRVSGMPQAIKGNICFMPDGVQTAVTVAAMKSAVSGPTSATDPHDILNNRSVILYRD